MENKWRFQQQVKAPGIGDLRAVKFIINIISRSRFLTSFLIDAMLRLQYMTYRGLTYLTPFLEPDHLHPKHRIMAYHDWFLLHIDKNWTVLDVGCGNGALTLDLAKHTGKVVGIDNNSHKIHEAKAKYRRENIDYIQGDAITYSYSQKFDAIVLSNVLEHIAERRKFLNHLSQFSDIFLIRVPMLDRDWLTLYKKERNMPYLLDPTHHVEYTLESFMEEVSKADLKVNEHRVRFGELYAICHKTS